MTPMSPITVIADRVTSAISRGRVVTFEARGERVIFGSVACFIMFLLCVRSVVLDRRSVMRMFRRSAREANSLSSA
jgi:hypothetical protein